jgi:hypothetical protein
VRRARPLPTQLDVPAALRFASARLREPAPRSHIVRVDPKGRFVCRFVAPLDWCLPLNRFAELEGWARDRLKKAVRFHMVARQGLRERAEPLPGRPMIRAIRFSSTESDEDNGWTKVPVDRLTGKHGGLNFIADDRPSKLELVRWWEPAPRGQGFAYFELWSGES